jgi:hypothetical protein
LDHFLKSRLKMLPAELGLETGDEDNKSVRSEFLSNLKHEPEVLFTNYLVPTVKENFTAKSFLLSVSFKFLKK